MLLLSKVAIAIDKLNERAGRVAGWFVLLTVIATFFAVFFRNVYVDFYSIALQESTQYFHALVFMIGIAYTFKHNEHVRVDIFYQNFSSRKKAWVDLLGAVFFLTPICVFILWTSADYVFNSWRDFEGSRETGGLPFLYIMKSFILLMAGLLLLQAFSQLIHAIEKIKKVENEAEQEHE